MKTIPSLNAIVSVTLITMALNISKVMAIEALIPSNGVVNGFVTSGASSTPEQAVTPNGS
ncbi:MULTISPECIES: hypothetical protein [Methylotenera]|uniref:hypothetical protein n=1 Tax=Methylotenera TaxID=359407 RepID=UPI0003A79BA3|nr:MULTISPECIES: hypothetical protein [Methylotenera]